MRGRMKILLITPGSSYSIGKLLENSFSAEGHEVAACDPEKLIPRWKQRLDIQAFRLPYRLRKPWENLFYKDLNKKFRHRFEQEKPDMVMIYNDSMLLPETAQIFKKKARVVFYLGDNPYYTWNKPYFLSLLMEADYIFAPDTMWIEQLKMIGIKNIYFETLGWDKNHYFPKEPTLNERKKYTSDLLFIGNSYTINWGYKRALFLNQFADMDLKIYGSQHWDRWLSYFPELRKKFVLIPGPLGLDQVNTISNCCKLYPVDANPGLLHGLHARIFDCIGSGILPLVEYRKDLERVFTGIDIPMITHYNEAHEKAQYYLDNENERQELTKQLRQYILTNFLPEHALRRMSERIFPKNL